MLSNTIISYQTLSFPIIFHYYFSLSESLSVTPVGLWRAQAERIGNIFKSHALSTSALQHLSCFFVWDSPDLIQDFCLHLCGGWRKLNLKTTIRRFSYFLSLHKVPDLASSILHTAKKAASLAALAGIINNFSVYLSTVMVMQPRSVTFAT